MIEIAREKTSRHSAADRIAYFEGSAESLPVEDSSADVFLAFDSYDHWQDQARGLKEVRRVLKSNGLFVVVKNGGLPNGADAKKVFLAGLSDAGFEVAKKSIDESEVSFFQWVCLAES